MSRTPLVSLLMAVLLAGFDSRAVAQTPAPGDWTVVDRQPAGAALVVALVGGEEIAGSLLQTRDIDLTLARRDGVERTVPKSAVVEVRTRARASDPLRNGMTYGGLAGAAAMGAFVSFLFSTCEGTCDAPSVLTVLVPALALGAGAGLGAGAAVDAAIRRPLVLYRRSRN